MRRKRYSSTHVPRVQDQRDVSESHALAQLRHRLAGIGFVPVTVVGEVVVNEEQPCPPPRVSTRLATHNTYSVVPSRSVTPLSAIKRMREGKSAPTAGGGVKKLSAEKPCSSLPYV